MDKRVLHISALAALLQFITYATNFSFTPIIAGNLGQIIFNWVLSTAFNLPQVAFSVLATTVMIENLGQKKHPAARFFC